MSRGVLAQNYAIGRLVHVQCGTGCIKYTIKVSS